METVNYVQDHVLSDEQRKEISDNLQGRQRIQDEQEQWNLRVEQEKETIRNALEASLGELKGAHYKQILSQIDAMKKTILKEQGETKLKKRKLEQAYDKNKKDIVVANEDLIKKQALFDVITCEGETNPELVDQILGIERANQLRERAAQTITDKIKQVDDELKFFQPRLAELDRWWRLFSLTPIFQKVDELRRQEGALLKEYLNLVMNGELQQDITPFIISKYIAYESIPDQTEGLLQPHNIPKIFIRGESDNPPEVNYAPDKYWLKMVNSYTKTWHI